MKTIGFDSPYFTNRDKAREYLEKVRWPDGPVCPHCGSKEKHYPLHGEAHRKGLWKCKECRKQFSVTVGTVFERSHIPLNQWLLASFLLCSSKKGMSAHQLHRMLNVTYKTAWFIFHRIRYAMDQKVDSPFTGTVEMDETYVGGKFRVRYPLAVKPGERPMDRLSPFANKAAVVSLVQRGGSVRSYHVKRVTAKNLRPIVDEMVAKDAHLMTDTSSVLESVGANRKHSQVNHTEKEYVRYENGQRISTNTIEGYFSILKRGINGIYHHVDSAHLHRYLSEFDFRYNERKATDAERSVTALIGIEGKRLMYRDSSE